ncbi:MAG: phosphatase PAP2 family protein [Dysgonamonadaceae bacterium]|jgi:hypothetical protein|nr:phosphatase PAP2 family protein [Dysgonamonadaceae bacterium]
MKDNITAVIVASAYIALTYFFIGLRPEHVILTGAALAAFLFNEQSRKLIVGLLPFVVFGISYDWMRVFPNYLVNPVDTGGLYNLEKTLFGIMGSDGNLLIPSEYFAIHNSRFMDILAGIFYLGWVPVPVFFAIYLYFKGYKSLFLQFSLVFLFVNLIGFTIYYIHPAAPPWYAMYYGFEPVIGAPGNVAGLGRFDELTGLHIFSSIYGRNANVFAAVPSLHASYLVIALFYSLKGQCQAWISAVLAVFMFGIWFTAVYSAHHYIIDVILGILCAASGILIFELVLMRRRRFRKFLEEYTNYIK